MTVQLPAELLTEIFLLNLPERPSELSMLIPLRFSQVCGYWRYVAQHSPMLWSQIYYCSVIDPVQLKRESEDKTLEKHRRASNAFCATFFDMMCQHLSFASNAPMDVSMRLGGGRPRDRRILCALLQHAPISRWKTALVYVAGWTNGNSHLPTVRLPNPESGRQETVPFYSSELKHIPKARNACPHLRSVELRCETGNPLSFSIFYPILIWSQVKELHWEGSAFHFLPLSLSGSYRALRRATLNSTLGPGYFSSILPLQLLSIAPNLEYLDTVADLYQIDRNITRRLEELQGNSSRVVLVDDDSEGYLTTRILHPKLSHLIVRDYAERKSMRYDTNFPENALTPFFHHLILPSLQHLKIHVRSDSSWRPEELTSMLRRSSTRPGSASLKTFGLVLDEPMGEHFKLDRYLEWNEEDEKVDDDDDEDVNDDDTNVPVPTAPQWPVRPPNLSSFLTHPCLTSIESLTLSGALVDNATLLCLAIDSSGFDSIPQDILDLTIDRDIADLVRNIPDQLIHPFLSEINIIESTSRLSYIWMNTDDDSTLFADMAEARAWAAPGTRITFAASSPISPSTTLFQMLFRGWNRRTIEALGKLKEMRMIEFSCPASWLH